MLITLDSQKLDHTYAATETLQALLDQIRADHVPDRLIIGVAYNGQTLADEHLSEALGQPVPAETQVDLQTGDRRELICTALREMAIECEEAGHTAQDLASRFDAGEVNAAIRDIGPFVKMWQTCYQGLTQCNALLGRDIGEFEHNGRDIGLWLHDLVEKLAELRTALENQDLTLLTDLLRYEMTPACERWHTLLNDVAGQIKEAPTTD